MNRYIKRIKINDLFHLHNIEIPIADDAVPHLILTGKNGSGKTVLLNAVVDFLNKIKSDTNYYFLNREKTLKYYEDLIKANSAGEAELARNKKSYDSCAQKISDLKGRVDIEFENVVELIKEYNEDNFIIAFYEAARKTKIAEPTNPTKPVLITKGRVESVLTSQLLNFLSDLKIQEALARNEGLANDADNIKEWFENFEDILRGFFEDPNLKIKFNYRDYTFLILTNGKSFKFTELSDGFIAILDIVADLILKMSAGGNISTEFNKPGIVLIDEIETHLHLKLQKVILPMLVSLFPNVQFIVTTHSPFVLNSLPNATAFDMEHQEPISDLTEYSYQALTEGYFGVSTESDYARQRFEELKALLKKTELSDTERVEAQQILSDYRKIPEATAPELVGAYRQLEIEYSEKIKAIEA